MTFAIWHIFKLLRYSELRFPILIFQRILLRKSFAVAAKEIVKIFCFLLVFSFEMNIKPLNHKIVFDLPSSRGNFHW